MRSAARRSIAALTACCFALSESVIARAGPIDISPVTVTLTPPARVAQITIQNPSDQPLRIQVSGFAWTDAADGSIEMTPAQDIIVFPQLVTIPPLGTQQIRAAIMSPAGAVERTYRILLDVLPPLSGTDQLSGPGVELSIRTRFTIPIFQEPLVRRMSGEIATAAANGGKLKFTIVNSGNAHLGGDEIRIIGRNNAGGVVFSYPFRGWYVLIDGKRAFFVDVPQAGCRDVRSLTIAPSPEMSVPPKKIEVEGVCGG
jgi:P pilus assembly chaperone PapD